MTKKTTTPDIDRLLDLLVEVVRQEMDTPEGNLSSWGITAYADILRVLADYGRVGIIDEWADQVIATWPDEGA